MLSLPCSALPERANPASTDCLEPPRHLRRCRSNCRRLLLGVRRNVSRANTPCSAFTCPATRWAIFTIQDMTGVQELLAFPESFARLEPTLKPGNPLLLKVRVQVEEAGTRLSLQEARRLDEVTERAASGELRVRIEIQSLTEETLDLLEGLFAASPGMCAVVFELCSPDGCVAVLQAQQRVKSAPELLEAVREICGNPAVRMVPE